MNDRTKQPVGMRISEKCLPVFRLQSLSSRSPAAGSNWSEFIYFYNRATVFSRVLFLTLISFPKNAAKSAVGECLAEVLFLKENKSTLLFPQRSALCLCVYVFPCCFSSLNMSKQPGEKNGREKSLCNEFKLSRNSNSVTETQIKIVPECLIS